MFLYSLIWSDTSFLFVMSLVFMFLALPVITIIVPVGVFQGVYRLLELAGRWGHICNHYGLAVATQAVF